MVTSLALERSRPIGDDDAVVWAKQQIEDHSLELWSGPRLVRRLDPEEKRAAEAVTHTIEAGRMVPKNIT